MESQNHPIEINVGDSVKKLSLISLLRLLLRTQQTISNGSLQRDKFCGLLILMPIHEVVFSEEIMMLRLFIGQSKILRRSELVQTYN